MSPWQDNLGRVEIGGQSRIGAAFRGVPFFLVTSERSGGRRGPLHEFPARDIPSFDDQGESPNVFPVEGYVIGDEYLAERDRLIAALRERGVGELQHPYHGTIQVVCQTWSVRESARDGGTATFAMSFVRAEQLVEPAPSVVPVEVARLAADTATASVKSEFVGKYSTSGLAPAYIASAERVIEQIGKAINTALAPIITSADELAKTTLRVNVLISDSAAYARAPENAFNEVVAAIDGVIEFGLDAVDALLSLASFVAELTDGGQTTKARVTERENARLLEDMIRGAAVTACVRAAISADYETYDQAVDVQRRIIEAIDFASERSGDDVYLSMGALKASVVRAIPDENARLPRLVPHVLQVAQPSVVVAYELYGDQAREADLVRRNGVENPMFVPAGVVLKVLA